MTPREIAAIRDGNHWSVRVVPNKFPALRIEEQDERHEDGRLFRFMGGCGAHEVIIDSPDHFRWVDPALLRPLASLLKHVLSRLHFGLGNPDYNLTINTAPRGEEDSEYFSWHVQILPRLTTPAGFELGSGMSINTMLPEDAARFLLAVEVP